MTDRVEHCVQCSTKEACTALGRCVARPNTGQAGPSDALAPCPFCGGVAYTHEDDGKYFVGCRDCFCMVGEAYDRSAMPEHMFDAEAEAIAAWNRRAAPKSEDLTTAKIDGLEEAITECGRWDRNMGSDSGKSIAYYIRQRIRALKSI